MGRTRVDPRRIAPTALAAALAVVYLVWAPPSLDLAAAEYRAWLFGHAGLAVWDGQWYGGHHLLGYSVLFPPLGWWLGPRLVGALAIVAATMLFERLATSYADGARAGALWFALGAAALLYAGRLTFALGLVPALGALVALQRGSEVAAGGSCRRESVSAGSVAFAGGAAETLPPRHPPDRASALTPALGLALMLAALTPLASPVAALFLTLAGIAYALAARRAVGLVLAAAVLAPAALLAIAFPEGGSEPFVFSAFWPVIAFAAAALVLLPREERTLRIGIALYALVCVAAYVVDTPVGGNVTRLGALCAGPVLALTLWRRRMLALALLAPALLWWQWTAGVLAVATTSGDKSVHAAYYAPPLRAIDRAGGPPGRVEIPFTRSHWEARWVASRRPLARGWERQLDVGGNALFYEGTLTPARYRAWLDRLAVRWVALPDAPLDDSAKDEARLIRTGLPYLREVWRDAHWRLFAVASPTPLADPPARVTRLDTDSLTLTVPRPATVGLRVRWTPYWNVAQGDACVAKDGDWTRVIARRAGTIRLTTRFSLDRVRATAPRCNVTARPRTASGP